MVTYKRLKEVLKPKAYADLMKYMSGQTVPLGGIYEWDFMRWIDEREVID